MALSDEIRRHYLIDYRFQLRMAIRILLLLLFTSVVIGWTIYYEIGNTAEQHLQSLVQQGALSIPQLKGVHDALRSSILHNVSIRFLMLLFIAFVFTIFATHRIAGPIYRIEKTLNQICCGNVKARVRLRKRDEFQSLASSINRLLDRYESHEKE